MLHSNNQNEGKNKKQNEEVRGEFNTELVQEIELSMTRECSRNVKKKVNGKKQH